VWKVWFDEFELGMLTVEQLKTVCKSVKIVVRSKVRRPTKGRLLALADWVRVKVVVAGGPTWFFSFYI
jgi:hypothetical protein